MTLTPIERDEIRQQVHAVRSHSRALFALVLVGFLLISASYAKNTARIGSDEKKSCLIQARGLPASRALSRSMGDLHYLTVDAYQRADQTERRFHLLTPAQLAKQKYILADLNTNLYIYRSLTAEQPKNRSC